MTDTPAAFQATFSDWRLVKGRKVVQCVFEVPIEGAGLAYDVLGGMPDPSKSVWCAIARLQQGRDNGEQTKAPETAPRLAAPDNPQPSGARKRWDEMPAAQQAGILCGEPAFSRYLQEKHGYTWLLVRDPEGDRAKTAASAIRQICNVTSRKDLTDNPKWSALVLDYRLWQRSPEFVE